MSTHAFTENALERATMELFVGNLGWNCQEALVETFGPKGTLGRETARHQAGIGARLRRNTHAAWELLLEGGAGAVSVDAIVTRARLSKGTFFHFFPTKTALLEELCAQVAAASWAVVGPVLEDRTNDPLQRLDAWLRVSRAWHLERPRAVSGLFAESTQPESAIVMTRIRSLSVEILAPALTAVADRSP
jgi:AcrR family transcriptional regulator